MIGDNQINSWAHEDPISSFQELTNDNVYGQVLDR